MELYIHFGIYKTGSSYLQYLCANSVLQLAKGGYYFPSSPYDKLMQNGIISPGNSGNLHDLLKQENIQAVSKLLMHWATAARQKKCEKVLISGESLVHNFTIREGLETLMSATKEAGFSKVKALGYVRDFVDHAISTYKHRGKSGKIRDFHHWVANIYETPTVLANFVQLHKEIPVDWTLRKFQKDSTFMAKSFFEDWLEILAPQLDFQKRVNESVTVSEILVINELSKIFPTTVDYFVGALNKLGRDERADDKEVEEYFWKIAKCVLNQKQGVIKLVNKQLRVDEQLNIILGNKEKSIQSYPVAKLSEQQIRILMRELIKMSSFSGQLVLFKRKIALWLPTFLKRGYKRYKLQNV